MDDWQILFKALALVMVIEGVLPFLSPRTMRKVMLQMASMDEKAMRLGGLFSMVAGAVLLAMIGN